jgi:DNA-binding transcriptional LysR family regulator
MDLLSLVPDYTAEEYVQGGALKRVDYPAFQGRLSAGVVYLKDRHLTPALQRFIRIARETATARYARKR